MNPMQTRVPAGGAVTAMRAKRLMNAAIVYAGISDDARKTSVSCRNFRR
jgi:hypothetical protein